MKTSLLTFSTRVDITVYQHGKCFTFFKYLYFPIVHNLFHATRQDLVSFYEAFLLHKNHSMQSPIFRQYARIVCSSHLNVRHFYGLQRLYMFQTSNF